MKKLLVPMTLLAFAAACGTDNPTSPPAIAPVLSPEAAGPRFHHSSAIATLNLTSPSTGSVSADWSKSYLKNGNETSYVVELQSCTGTTCITPAGGTEIQGTTVEKVGPQVGQTYSKSGLATGVYRVRVTGHDGAQGGDGPVWTTSSKISVTGASAPATDNRQTQSVTITAPTAATFGDHGFTVSAAAAPSGLDVTLSIESGPCTISGAATPVTNSGTVTVTGVGDCVVKAFQAGTAAPTGWHEAFSTHTIVVSPRQISVAAVSPAAITYGAATPTFSYSLGTTSFANATDAAAFAATVTYALTDAANAAATASPLDAGSYTITPNWTYENANYTITRGTPATGTLTVDKAPQTIGFDLSSLSKTFGDAPFTISATGGASGNPVTFASGTTGKCTLATVEGVSTVTIVEAGLCTITASQAGNNNYLAATNVSQSTTIQRASQAITFGALENQVFVVSGSQDLIASASSNLAVTLTSLTPTVCTVSGTTVSHVKFGTCTVQASQAGNVNYLAAQNVSQGFTIAAWGLGGFFAPVDMNGIINTVKAGSTVALKFTVLAGSTPKATVDAVKSFTISGISCPATAAQDEVEITTTGGTSLRYDATAGQFIQNYQTSKTLGCYRATMTTQDGSTLIALFRTR
jgi:hypothetical protein